MLFCAFFLAFLALLQFCRQLRKRFCFNSREHISNDPYNSLSSWVSIGDPCQYYNGVFYKSIGFVERIVLWNTSLAGVLSPALSSLKYSRILTLFGNQFLNNIPQEYASIQTLWKINFSSNALSESIQEFIVDLPSIQFLDKFTNSK